MGPRNERRIDALKDLLRALVRELREVNFANPDTEQEDQPGQLEIAIQAIVTPKDGWAVEFTPPLDEQIVDQLADALSEQASWEPTHVHCFRCKSAACSHSRPPNALSVFKGYSSTGVPEWHEFVQALIEADDARVDQLFEDEPPLLTVITRGSSLRAAQLASFGRSSRTYAILGQVTCGYLAPRRAVSATTTPRRIALTFQLVEHRDAARRTRLTLNTIPGGLDADAWGEVLAACLPPGVARAIRAAEASVHTLQRRVGEARDEADHATVRRLMKRVPGILNRLARELEQGARQARRRTRHAEQRQPIRPVGKALEDSHKAPDTALYVDLKRNTFVVCGPQHRAHAFTHDGRHVTTFKLPSDGAEFRVRTRRWRPMTTEETKAFRLTLPAAS